MQLKIKQTGPVTLNVRKEIIIPVHVEADHAQLNSVMLSHIKWLQYFYGSGWKACSGEGNAPFVQGSAYHQRGTAYRFLNLPPDNNDENCANLNYESS